MNFKIITLLILATIPCFGQNSDKSKIISGTRIGISKDYKTVLIFPEPIEDYVVGNSLEFVVFGKKPNSESLYANRLLKIQLNDESKGRRHTNLVVFTHDGRSYEFILFYNPEPQTLTYYIDKKEAVENLAVDFENNNKINTVGEIISSSIPIEVGAKTVSYTNGVTTVEYTDVDDEFEEQFAKLDPDKRANLYETNRYDYYRQKCYYNQFKKPYVALYKHRRQGVEISLKGVYFNKNEIYINFAINNYRGQPFDIDLVRFSIATEYKKRISTSQITPISPVFKYKVPKRVKPNSENHFFIVFDKFTISENKNLRVEIGEKNGERDLELNINHLLINDPRIF